MRAVVECLKAQHRDVEESIDAVARLAASGRREECLRAFAALAARIVWQLDAEEELLGPLYGAASAEPLREDHRQLRRLVASCGERLADDELLHFADDAQSLMLKFALHAGREERALAAGDLDDEPAVGLFVERMAPRR